MKKLFLIFIFIFLTGCTNISEEQLKQEIKDELNEEMVFDPSSFNEHLTSISSTIDKWTVSIEIIQGEFTMIGSGILYSKNDNEYKVLTNEHVVRYADSIEIYIPYKDIYITASVERSDLDLDLAILSFSSLTELEVYEIVDVDYQIGEMVLACGTATSQDYANSVTLGIISNIDDNRIQHDASINNGNSGGPLFNFEGKLIGLNVSKINTTYIGNSQVFVEGIGFSIGIDDILYFLSQ